jgi:Lon protease-like protein
MMAPADVATPPGEIPIFPLPGVLLLPRGELALHIFEPRYRNMAREALAGPEVIGMVQPSGPDDQSPQPPVYGTGCAGRMTELRTTEDGRYYFTLVGLCRFRIAAELAPKDGYRRVVADYSPYIADLDGPGADAIDRSGFLSALSAYLDRRGVAADWDAIREAPDERLVTAIAMAFPFEDRERQAVLEATTLAARADLMTALMEMASLSPEGERPRRH